MSIVSIPVGGDTASFLVSEARGYRSREQGVVASGSGKLPAGTILGRVSRGAAAAPTSAAVAGNTGNGTLGSLTADADTPQGQYRVRFTEATKFTVYRPDGSEEGRGTVGVAYNGGVNFTITAGGTPFAPGDGFNVLANYAAGSLKYVPYLEGGANGSQRFAAILYQPVDATSADVDVTLIVRDAEVQRSELAFSGSPTTDGKNAAYAAMAAMGIALR